MITDLQEEDVRRQLARISAAGVTSTIQRPKSACASRRASASASATARGCSPARLRAGPSQPLAPQDSPLVGREQPPLQRPSTAGPATGSGRRGSAPPELHAAPAVAAVATAAGTGLPAGSAAAAVAAAAAAASAGPPWVAALKRELLEALHEEFRAVNKTVREIKREVTDGTSVCSALKRGFAEMRDVLEQGKQVDSHPDLTELLKEVQSINQSIKRDVDPSAALAGTHRDMADTLKEIQDIGAGMTLLPSSVTCQDAAADRLELILDEVSKVRAQMDFSPIIKEIQSHRPVVDMAPLLEQVKEIRSHRPVVDLSPLVEQVKTPLIEQIKKSRAKVDLTEVLDEIRRVRSEVDFTPVLREIRAAAAGRAEADHANVAEEEEAYGGSFGTPPQPKGHSGRDGSEQGRTPQTPLDEALAEPKTTLCAGTGMADPAEVHHTLGEHQALKSDLHEARWELQRLEAATEKKMSDHDRFLELLSHSSAKPVLSETYDLGDAAFLGKGHYGYVLRCKRRDTGERVVAKVMSERWARVAVSEWAHGAEGGKHPYIVKHIEVLMHRDSDGELRKRIASAFDAGILSGKCPDSFPSTFFCFMLEFMDHGSAQQLSEKGLLTMEGCAAIARQVASALAFMHRRKRTHNDVKPENILLQQSPSGKFLVAKLADMGLAEHSADRVRDHDLFAYTIWCLVLGRSFTHCPVAGDAREAAASQLRGDPAVRHAGALGTALAGAVRGLWKGRLGADEVEALAELQGHEVRLEGGRRRSQADSPCTPRAQEAKPEGGRRRTV